MPPTLVSFAVSTQKTGPRSSPPSSRRPGTRSTCLPRKTDANGLPDFESLRTHAGHRVGTASADGTCCVRLGRGRRRHAAEGITKMALGNGIGFAFAEGTDAGPLSSPRCYGAFLLECVGELAKAASCWAAPPRTLSIRLDGETDPWPVDAGPLGGDAPQRLSLPHAHPQGERLPSAGCARTAAWRSPPAEKFAKPRVLIPVFPGTNCEYDTARVFAVAGC